MDKLATLFFSSILLFVFAVPSDLYSQNRDYQLANNLMQQQKYEEALPILQQLHEGNPNAFVFFEKLTETLINLGRIEDAIQIAENQVAENRTMPRAGITLAELYHINRQKDKAVEKWNEVVEANKDRIQTYFSVASSMTDRREYRMAIEMYMEARLHFENPQLFQSELANTYLQAGQFENAVKSFYELIENSPGQMGQVQQRLLRMRDQELYTIASLELEDFIMELETDHPAYSQLAQLLSWLLLEIDDYRRAFVFARRYESQTSDLNYSLFNLASRLQSARQYELAADAFKFYIENEPGLRSRATRELSETYQLWARYLEQRGLETQERQHELYQKAYDLNKLLAEEAPNYNRLDRVLSAQIDLSLDIFKDSDKADEWYQKLLELNNHENTAHTYYAEGRLALFRSDFTRARQALTRADRSSDDSNLSEKARYFLSLSDFYGGDYEFAEIQLRSLERRNTSYYANDAIKLRMWIKNGLRSDTTGSTIKALGEGLHHIHTGSYDKALNLFEPFLVVSNHPFSDDIAVELAIHLPESYKKTVYAILNRKAENMHNSPLRERILWERVKAAEKLNKHENFQPADERFADGELTFIFSSEEIEELYEELLMEFPGGFYAEFVREILQSTEIPAL